MAQKPIEYAKARAVAKAYNAAKGNISEAARAAGANYSTFDKRVRTSRHYWPKLFKDFPIPRGGHHQLSDADAQAAWDAFSKAGFVVRQAAILARLPRTTFEKRLKTYALRKGINLKTVKTEEEEKPETRAEIRNTEFWRNKANALDKDLHQVEHALAEIAGLRQVPIQPPKWTLPSTAGKRRKSLIGLLVSDVHMGEVIREGEILGINEFNVEICQRRLRRMFSACCTIGSRWIADTSNQGAVLFLTGDLISGDIHEELRITNACTAHEQVRLMVEEIVAGARHLVETYGHLLITSVPGNHGRTTIKPTAKLYSRLSYDTLIADMVRDRFLNDPRVTFQIGESFDHIVPMVGFPILQTHGDKTGTGGGQGFAGAMLPIVRGAKKVEHLLSRAGFPYYWMLQGHLHTSGQPGNVFSNGSVPGISEYGYGLRASLEPPQQWMFLVHELWGMRERIEIKLEDSLVLRKPNPAWL